MLELTSEERALLGRAKGFIAQGWGKHLMFPTRTSVCVIGALAAAEAGSIHTALKFWRASPSTETLARRWRSPIDLESFTHPFPVACSLREKLGPWINGRVDGLMAFNDDAPNADSVLAMIDRALIESAPREENARDIEADRSAVEAYS